MTRKLNNILNFILLMFFAVNLASSNVVFAKDNKSEENYVNEKIASIGFGKIFNNDPKIDITNLFKKLDNVSLKKDINKMQSLYSEDFISNDGYDFETYFNAVKSAVKDYKFNSVKTDIKNIFVSGEYAYAHVIENFEGESVEAESPYKEPSLVLSSSEVIYSLKKEGKDWKIYASESIDETSSFLYGEAKNIFFSIQAPNYVKSGVEYTASLSHSPVKEDTIIMASISSLPITYPTQNHENKFKYMKDECSLERVLIANSNGYNENIIAVAHLSKAKIVAANEVDIKPLGSAYVVKRINVLNVKKPTCIIKTSSKTEKQKKLLKKSKNIKQDKKTKKQQTEKEGK